MKSIILDTNLLMAIFQFKIDLFEELDRVMSEPYDVNILNDTIIELDYIVKKQNSKNKRFAKLVKQYIKLKKINIIDITKQKDLYITNISKTNKVDDLLTQISDDKDYIIATADIELKKRIKNKGNKLIYLRSKNHLEINWED